MMDAVLARVMELWLFESTSASAFSVRIEDSQVALKTIIFRTSTVQHTREWQIDLRYLDCGLAAMLASSVQFSALYC